MVTFFKLKNMLLKHDCFGLTCNGGDVIVIVDDDDDNDDNDDDD